MSSYSVVIPVYNNAGNIPQLLVELSALNQSLDGRLEAVFVVDGSPDDSYERLAVALPQWGVRSRLLLLSRNFGSFSAIREGLRVADGPNFAVMAADLQEPVDLVREFFAILESDAADVTYGRREGRADPWPSRLASAIFWWCYRHLVQREVPPGGVDVFGCNLAVRDQLLALGEANSTLVGLLFWIGFRRRGVGYVRQRRTVGRSGWTFRRKVKYLMDSAFAFSDLPIRLLTFTGALGLVVSSVLSCVVLAARLLNATSVPGYTATVLVVTFFAALNSFGLGLIGSYIWRTLENTRGRPLAIVMQARGFAGAGGAQ